MLEIIYNERQSIKFQAINIGLAEALHDPVQKIKYR